MPQRPLGESASVNSPDTGAVPSGVPILKAGAGPAEDWVPAADGGAVLTDTPLPPSAVCGPSDTGRGSAAAAPLLSAAAGLMGPVREDTLSESRPGSGCELGCAAATADLTRTEGSAESRSGGLDSG
jgi:hypothetical protein